MVPPYTPQLSNGSPTIMNTIPRTLDSPISVLLGAGPKRVEQLLGK